MKTLLIAICLAFATTSFASTTTTVTFAGKATVKKALSSDIGDNEDPKNQNPKPKG